MKVRVIFLGDTFIYDLTLHDYELIAMMMNLNLKSFVLMLSLALLAGCKNLPFVGKNEAMNEISLPTPDLDKSLTGHEFLLKTGQQVIGQLLVVETEEGDTLPDIARNFGLGHNAIVLANPEVEKWLPPPQTKVLLPLRFILPAVARQGIVLNLANTRLFYFPEKNRQRVITYPAGIGRDGWDTPMGLTKVISKVKNPTWTVPVSIAREHAAKGDILPKVVPAGADNPLGQYALKLSKSGYLIHGTNKPYGVGMQISHGCLNLYPEDISALFDITAVGTQVMIIDKPYLVAWEEGTLFLEAHPPLDKTKDFKKPLIAEIKQLVKKHKTPVDWLKVTQVLAAANGVPTPISVHSASFADLVANAKLIDHPAKLYGQPEPQPLTEQDWQIVVERFTDEKSARTLAAVLNHQGPMIPAQVVQQGEIYQVIAGPFHSKKESLKMLKRLEIELELKGTLNPPRLFMSLFKFIHSTV